MTSPSYTCNSAFNLNMVLCGMSSLNGNAGIIYECFCSPSCAWTQVANLNSAVTWINGQTSGNVAINATTNVWTQLVQAVLPFVGVYQCTFDSVANYADASTPCNLIYCKQCACLQRSLRLFVSVPRYSPWHPLPIDWTHVDHGAGSCFVRTTDYTSLQG